MRRLHADPLREVAAMALAAPAATPSPALEAITNYCWSQLACRRSPNDMAALLAELEAEYPVLKEHR